MNRFYQSQKPLCPCISLCDRRKYIVTLLRNQLAFTIYINTPDSLSDIPRSKRFIICNIINSMP